MEFWSAYPDIRGPSRHRFENENVNFVCLHNRNLILLLVLDLRLRSGQTEFRMSDSSVFQAFSLFLISFTTTVSLMNSKLYALPNETSSKNERILFIFFRKSTFIEDQTAILLRQLSIADVLFWPFVKPILQSFPKLYVRVLTCS